MFWVSDGVQNVLVGRHGISGGLEAYAINPKCMSSTFCKQTLSSTSCARDQRGGAREKKDCATRRGQEKLWMITAPEAGSTEDRRIRASGLLKTLRGTLRGAFDISRR